MSTTNNEKCLIILDEEKCTQHRIYLCEEAKFLVDTVKIEIERKHRSNKSQAINQIIIEWNQLKTAK